MSGSVFQTISGRKLQLKNLNDQEREVLAEIQQWYAGEPEWSEFTSWWMTKLERTVGLESVLYRICQDLEARLGIAQGKVAPPDYRDYLADLIEERYGTRYRFCKETGVDPGHLSRVLASRSDLSLEALQKILQSLRAALVIQPVEQLDATMSPQKAAEDLALAV